jgi:hypothetical protein
MSHASCDIGLSNIIITMNKYTNNDESDRWDAAADTCDFLARRAMPLGTAFAWLGDLFPPGRDTRTENVQAYTVSRLVDTLRTKLEEHLRQLGDVMTAITRPMPKEFLRLVRSALPHDSQVRLRLEGLELCIKHNTVDIAAPCGHCGLPYLPPLGCALFIEGEWAAVCDDCGQKLAPELRAVVEAVNPSRSQ